MKLFISADIEGITGIASFAQCGGPNGGLYDWPYARRMYVHDLNAAIRGAVSAGVTQIVVKDGHAACRNILVDELDEGTRLISGQGPTPDGMMQGIDESFDAAILVGYHAMAGRLFGMMDHALVGGIHRFWMNGVECGEIAVSTAAAAEVGVPLIAVTSDEAGCEEARSQIPGAHAYATKEGFGRAMGRMRHPSETSAGIEEAVRSAVLGLSRMPAVPEWLTRRPCTMRAAFRSTQESELPALLPGVARVDGYALEWTCPSFREAHRLAYAIFALSIQGRNG